ncbi:MAG: SDR family oxidoreductase [Desulfobacterales bacterium]|nr:SDR family oxidoreductase [Desulfobacterales bacterium]
MKRQNFDERVALVTGGAQGIGLAVVRRLAKAGAKLAIADVNMTGTQKAAEEFSTESMSVKPFHMDVTDPDSVQSTVGSILRDFGRIDILVNNAGIVGRTAPIQDQSAEDWSRIIATDLTGVFFCCKAVVPHMVEQAYGRIVNISSIAGKEGNPNMVPYCTAKAGVIGLTKALAKEVARSNVMVNAVTPALIDTPMVQDIAPDQVDYLTERIPVGRLGRAEEVAAMVLWLASEEVSFSTGAVFDVSGGRASY